MVTFRDAGHILGAASLEITDLSPDSEIKKIVLDADRHWLVQIAEEYASNETKDPESLNLSDQLKLLSLVDYV